MQSCQSFLFRGWKWPLTPQLTYLLLLATCLTLDLLWNADCQRLPNLEQFKRICTLSLICATLQSKFPSHGKLCLLVSSSLSLFFFFMEKNADVENQKSTVLTDAPAEVQPCEGWCFPVGGTRLAAMAALTTSCLYFHPRTNLDQGLKGKLPVIKSK